MKGRWIAGIAAALVLAPSARADDASLYRGRRAAARARTSSTRRPPTRRSCATRGPGARRRSSSPAPTSYRDGEFVYQDFLYDDHGANGGQRDPGDPRSGDDTFSQPNGTYTYPTDPGYAQNAADLVELRVRPLADATAFRLTLNTLLDAERVAATIAIGSLRGAACRSRTARTRRAPAELFLTVHGPHAELLDRDRRGAHARRRR